MQEFATVQDFQESLGVFISEFTGGSPDKKMIAKAGINTLSYGTGLLVGGMKTQMMDSHSKHLLASPEECAKVCRETLEQLRAPRGPEMGAFPWQDLPWGTIFMIAMQLLKKYFPSLPIPVPPAPGPVTMP